MSRLHISSSSPGMENFTGVPELSTFKRVIPRVEISKEDIANIKDFMSKFNIENFSDVIAAGLVDFDQEALALVWGLLKQSEHFSLKLVHAYARKLQMKVDTKQFLEIIYFLKSITFIENEEVKSILIVQNDNGDIEYKIQKDVLQNFYAVEA